MGWFVVIRAKSVVVQLKLLLSGITCNLILLGFAAGKIATYISFTFLKIAKAIKNVLLI